MKLKPYYNKWPLAALAKELRYLAWLLAFTALGSDFLGRGVLSDFVAAIAWICLQAAAVGVESVRLINDGDPDDKGP